MDFGSNLASRAEEPEPVIQPLRSLHRNTFLVLAVSLPLLVISGLLARHSWPTSESNEQASLPGNFVSEQTVDVDGRKVAVDVYSDAANPGAFRFVTTEPLAAPDVLVYWSEVGSSSSLPGDALLVGPFGTHTRYRPPVHNPTHGYLILYSVARQQLLAAFSVEARP